MLWIALCWGADINLQPRRKFPEDISWAAVVGLSCSGGNVSKWRILTILAASGQEKSRDDFSQSNMTARGKDRLLRVSSTLLPCCGDELRAVPKLQRKGLCRA